MRIGLRNDGTANMPIAICGQTYVRVCLEGGAIQTGDLLVSSSSRGVAMRCADLERAFGAVIGKALEPFNGHPENSEGLVKMLVMSR
jgi:hypothetical protein